MSVESSCLPEPWRLGGGILLVILFVTESGEAGSVTKDGGDYCYDDARES